MTTYIFAAAKDGDVFLSTVDASDIREAERQALLCAGEHHGFDSNNHIHDHVDGVPCDYWFDGFTIRAADELIPSKEA